MEPAGMSAAEWARALVEQRAPPQAGMAQTQRRAVAWALKDLCYAAWSSEPQRAVKAADALDALSRSAQPHDAEVEALAHWTAGIASVTRGRLAEAAAALDRAHDTFAQLSQADHAAATLVPRIMVLSMLGRYDEAIACAEQAQGRFIALGDRRAAAKVALNLGSLYARRGAYADAVRRAREAAVLFARVGDHEHSVMADGTMADALTSLGDFDEALRIYARADMRAAAHAFPVLQAVVAESVALLRLARGEYAEALAGFEKSRRRYEELDMPGEQAVAEKQLADAYLELRLLPEALTLFEQSLARQRLHDLGDEEPWTLAQRGRVHALLGQRPQAIESFVLAGELFAAQGHRVGEAAVTLARAELALADGEAGHALELASAASRGLQEAGLLEAQLRADVVRAHALLQAGSVEQARALFDATLAQAREHQLLSVQVRCLTGCGLAAMSAGETPLAHSAFTDAVALFEDQRRALPDAAIRSAFFSDHLRPYQELLRLAIADHARTGSAAASAQVLQRLDRCRARALGERVDAGVGLADSPAVRSTRARVNLLLRQVRQQQEQGEAATALIDDLRRTERQLLEQARRERLAGPTLAASDEGLDPAALQRQLAPGDVLVEYGVQDDELFACIVDNAGVAVHRRLARWPEVLEALRSARFQIESLRNGAAPVEQHLQQLIERARARLRRLQAMVWQPLAPALEGRSRILIVPHGQLGSVPFAALEDAQGCLADRHLLAVAPSARLALRGLMRPPTAPDNALVLGESTRLPHAAHEAQAVADLLGASTLAIGKDATLACLKAGAGQAGVIHLACHAQFRSDNPTFSALHLYDGALTVDLVEALGLRPAVVALSGCETGLSDAGSGDEMVGLASAFLVAGASRVLASLWPVDDAVTVQFMTEFYRALRRGVAAAAALAQAQQAVRDRHPHPLHWAAFTLYGGW